MHMNVWYAKYGYQKTKHVVQHIKKQDAKIWLNSTHNMGVEKESSYVKDKYIRDWEALNKSLKYEI